MPLILSVVLLIALVLPIAAPPLRLSEGKPGPAEKVPARTQPGVGEQKAPDAVHPGQVPGR
jgi:hypothetical protein